MSRQKTASIFLSCSAGAIAAGTMEGIALEAIEERTGLPICNLIDGCYVSSVGGPVTVPLLIKDPQNPSKPLFTVKESRAMFKEESPVWINETINPARQLLSSYIKIPFNRSAFHYDVSKIQHSIESQIGDATLGDIMTSLFIPVHKISASRARDTAELYHKLVYPDGREIYSPEQARETKLKDLLIATTAVPGLFRSAKIGTDDVCDFGHMDDSARALVKFQKSREPGQDIHFIGLGPPRYYGYHDASWLNRVGIIRQSMHLARSTSAHSYSSCIKLCEDILGPDNVRDLTPHIDASSRHHPTAHRSFLDCSPEHVEALEEIAFAYVLSDEFKRACDFLGENYIARTAPAAELPPALTQPLTKKHKLMTMLSSLIRPGLQPVPA